MAEGDMLLFPGLKTGYQNSGILVNIIWLSAKKSDTQKQRDTFPKTKQLREQDSDMTHLLGLLNLTWNLNMFNILKTLMNMMSNIKDHIF